MFRGFELILYKEMRSITKIYETLDSIFSGLCSDDELCPSRRAESYCMPHTGNTSGPFTAK